MNGTKYRNSKGQFKKGYYHPPKRKDLDLKIIVKRYFHDVESTQSIGDKMNVSQKTIENRLKEAGYKLRNRNDMTQQTRDKISNTMKIRGIKPIKQFRGKTSGAFKKGSISWNKDKVGLQISNKKGKTFEEIYGNKSIKIKSLIKKARAKQVTPTKDTSIEVKLQNFLKELKIKFVTHKYIKIKHGYQTDIFIPSMNLIIEAYGNYWHSYPIGRPIDIIRCNELREKGYKVLVLWENEINLMTLNDLKNELSKF